MFEGGPVKEYGSQVDRTLGSGIVCDGLVYDVPQVLNASFSQPITITVKVDKRAVDLILRFDRHFLASAIT